MMRQTKFLLLLVGFLCFCSSSDRSSAEWEVNEYGETSVFQMQNAPYPHESRKDGFTFKQLYKPPRDGHWVTKFEEEFFPRDPHYVDSSVGLFIPRGYRAGDEVDLLIFFHGAYMNVENSFKQEDWNLRKQVHESGKNVIMVVPQGPRIAADLGGGKLEDPDGLKRLVLEVVETLKQEGKIDDSARLGKIALTGHSAGYRVITYCVEHGGLEDHIEEVYILDGCHDRYDQLVAWAARNRRVRLFSVFTDIFGWQHVDMMVQMGEREVPYELIREDKVTDDLLRRRRVLLMFCGTHQPDTRGLTHHTTVYRLVRFLSTSGFADR